MKNNAGIVGDLCVYVEISSQFAVGESDVKVQRRDILFTRFIGEFEISRVKLLKSFINVLGFSFPQLQMKKKLSSIYRSHNKG